MQQAYLFIGQSGSGKGTQANLLEEFLKTNNQPPAVRVERVETGAKFREMLAGTTYTALHTKEIMNTGELPPSFLAVHIWAHTLIAENDGLSPVIIDGTPRMPNEVPILLGAAEFYNWNLHIIYIDVSDEWAYEKIKDRGRSDDIDEKRIWARLQWFHESVLPCLDLLKASTLTTFHAIHGEQTVEAVHDDIVHSLSTK